MQPRGAQQRPPSPQAEDGLRPARAEQKERLKVWREHREEPAASLSHAAREDQRERVEHNAGAHHERHEAKIAADKSKDPEDRDNSAIAQWEADLEAIKDEGIPELEETATAEHIAQGRVFLENLREWARQNTTSDGSLHHESRPPDIVRDERFNLNEYLPESEKIKISFWKVYPRRF